VCEPSAHGPTQIFFFSFEVQDPLHLIPMENLIHTQYKDGQEISTMAQK